MRSNVVTEPVGLAISIGEARHACKIDATSESGYEAAVDGDLTLLIQAATKFVVHATGRSIMKQGVEVYLDAFPVDGDVELALPNVIQITSVTYVSLESGLPVTLNANQYYLDAVSRYEAWLLRAEGVDWPVAAAVANAVVVKYEAGFESATNVPANVKMWIKSAVKFMYDNGGGGELPRDFNAGLLDEFNSHR